ncbi:GroES-like protein [Trametes coccinea BRFM310]|uniref:GroES-like protein n=1 Tax=Trametes coccinea (strain BRFM310) TaxID=1353009 RepID=A0A1Y2I995_TRAC3|nr:GroES-like protein [Trametes coccinea BRFM310]
MSPPSQQRALLLQSKQGEFAVGMRAVPMPKPGELLVKNEAVALNPLDWKIRALGIIVQDYPAVIGIDAAGVVEVVGDGVDAWKVGDRVLYQGDIENDHGTYQQYTLIDAKLVAKIPDRMSFEDAASLPLAVGTGAVGLYYVQGGPRFDPPWEEGGRGKYAGTPLVIMGGASTNGSLAIQWARLSGFSPIITTASQKNEEYLRSLGATHVLDRELFAVELFTQVKQIVGGRVPVVYDAISTAATQNAAFNLLGPGGKLLIVTPNALDEEKKAKATEEGDGRCAVNVLGIVQVPFLRSFGEALFAHLSALLDEGALKPPKVEVISGGLSGIVSGLEKLQDGEVSAQKLVVRLAGTT